MTIACALAAVACGDTGPWYDVEPAPDLSYLPLGPVSFEESGFSWTAPDGETVAVDAYVPAEPGAPVAVMLPGAFIIKDRYRWLGATLASHGVATFLVQPSTAFASSKHTLGTLAALAERPDLDLDFDRVLLAGHSAGGLAQVGLTELADCPPGICAAGDRTPPGLRGLALLGYHHQQSSDDAAPIAAAEIPWLLVSGSRDGLATPDEVAATVARIQDRPLYALSVTGMNHFQLTDYVDPAADLLLDSDLEPDVGNRDARATAALYLARFARRTLFADESIDDDLGAASDARVALDHRPPRIGAPDAHGLPRVFAERVDVALPGADVVGTAALDGALYLLVRDEDAGASLWRMSDDGSLAEVAFPGRRVPLNTLMGALAVYRDRLWVGLSSGVQGAEHASLGAELWSYDGRTWTPVIAHAADADDELAIAGCSERVDGTVELVVAGAAWQPGELAGASADDGAAFVLELEDSDGDTLVARRNRLAGTDDDVTRCAELPDALWLRVGDDENGFGDPWNKAIVAMAVLEGRLLVGTGLNYDRGGELWATADGETFELAVPREAWGYHADGTPLTSSISALHVSSLTGEPVLYVGGTGTNDYGARLGAYRADGSFSLVLDAMPHDSRWVQSIATWRDRLWIATSSFSGFELWSMDAAGAWRTEMGADGAFGLGWGDASQLTARLFVLDDQLWVADVTFVQTLAELADKSAYVWRTADGQRWQLVTAHAFGVNAVSASQIFDHGGARYAVAASGALAAHKTFRPIRLYTLEEQR